MLPNYKDVYKPRKDAAILSRLVQDAWKAKNRELESSSDDYNVGEIVATHLEQRYPFDDMCVLKRYSAARPIDTINVTIYNEYTKLWDQGSSVKLPRTVLVPTSGVSVYVLGPRFSEQPTRGIFPEKWATMTSLEQSEIIDHQDRSEARQLPKSVESFFRTLLHVRAAYRDEYKQATEWPTQHRKDHGKYPDWSTILERFPVLGAHVRKLRYTTENSQ